MAKKKVVAKKVKSDPAGISIEMEPTMVSFNMVKDGVEQGVIRDTLCNLHKFILISQDRSFEGVRDREGHDYMADLAKDLTDKYGIQVTEDAAYQIAYNVFRQFEEEKKSIGS